jgi:hypothetical protein
MPLLDFSNCVQYLPPPNRHYVFKTLSLGLACPPPFPNFSSMSTEIEMCFTNTMHPAHSHDKNSVCLQKQDEHTCNTRLDVTQLWESTNLATTLLLNCPLENLLTISSLYELLNHLRSCNVQSHHYVFPQLWWS